MRVDLGNADAAVGISLGVVDQYLAELIRLGRLPTREFDRDFGGTQFRVTVSVETLQLVMERPDPDSLRTILVIGGTFTAQLASDPNDPPGVHPFTIGALLSLVLVPGAVNPDVGLRYDGPGGAPFPPVTEADIDAFMTSPEVQAILDGVRLPLAENLVAGLNPIRFPDSSVEAKDWDVALTLTPAVGDGSVDAFVVSAAMPGRTAALALAESFVAPNTGLALAYGRTFLDEMLAAGAAATVGTEVDESKVTALDLSMADTGIRITGHVVRDVSTPIIDLAPDVDIDISGIAVPRLVRGTTALTIDTSGVDVDVDDSDEIFYGALQWIVTIGAVALVFTGIGELAALGIVTWLTAVQAVWNKAVELDHAPGVVRDGLAASLGAQLTQLAASLDDDFDAGELRVDGTPDSATVVDGCIVLSAQVIVQSMTARLRSAEYSHRIRRFAIFQLDGQRRFRAQELARLMKAGKVVVPGFHQVRGRWIRSDHDNSAANNLLREFKGNETKEIVVRNRPGM